MESSPCGCEQAEDAQTARPGEREALLERAPASQERWRCPRGGCEPGPLSDEAEQAARAVEVLTGCERGAFKTCPRHEASAPDVLRALRIYRATQGGGLSYDDDPPAVIVHAAEVIGGADAARMDCEQKEREAERG